MYFPKEEFGFDIAEEKLVEKANKIIYELNYDFYFKMIKIPVPRIVYNNFRKIIEPYKTIFDKMIRLKTRSASFL